MTPKYRHDSSCCQFLGTRRGYDLYYCDGSEGSSRKVTVIARYGNNPEDYASGYQLGLKYFFLPKDAECVSPAEALGWALRIAVNRGLMAPSHIKRFYDDCRDWYDRQIAIAMRGKTRRTCPLCSVCSGELQITYDLNHEGVPELFRVSCADCGYTVGYYDDIQSAVAAATTVQSHRKS